MDRTWEYSRDDQLLSSELAYDSFFWCCNGRKLLRKQQTRHLVEQISCQHLLQVLFQLLWEVGRDSLWWRLCQPPDVGRVYHSPSFVGDSCVSQRNTSPTRLEQESSNINTCTFRLETWLPWRLTAGTCPHGGGLRSFSFLNGWICRFHVKSFGKPIAFHQRFGLFL